MPSDGGTSSDSGSGTTTGTNSNTGFSSSSSSGSFWSAPSPTYGTPTYGPGSQQNAPAYGDAPSTPGNTSGDYRNGSDVASDQAPPGAPGSTTSDTRPFAERHPFLNALAQFGVVVTLGMLGVPAVVAAAGYAAAAKWAKDNPGAISDAGQFDSVMQAAKPVGASGGASWANQGQITTAVNAAGGGAAAATGGGTTATGAADTALSIGRDSLNFAMQQYADGKTARDRASETSDSVAQAQLAAQKQQTAIAADYDAYNKSTFRPLEQKIVSDAQGYDTEARRAEAIAGATSDVEQGYARSNSGLTRTLQRSGVTQGSGRMQSLLADQAIAKANSLAGATTGAVRNVETVGAAKMADAANLGRNLPSAQATAAQTGINAGTSAVGSAAAGVAAQNSGVAGVNSAYNTAINATTGAGQLYGQAEQRAITQKQNENSSNNAIWQGLGSAFGAYVASDKSIKKGTGRMADKAKALTEINATKVEDGWSYDPAKGGPDDGGMPHTGPMAQTVRRTMGEDAAPGGKAIDLVSMNGKMMASIQELSSRMSKLERRAA